MKNRINGTIKFFRSDGQGYVEANGLTYPFVIQSVTTVDSRPKPPGPFFGHEETFLKENPSFFLDRGNQVSFVIKDILGRGVAFDLNVRK